VIWRCRRIVGVAPLYDAELKDGVEVYAEPLDGDEDE
jgi:hypothetical protein